jgi:hypothetical protein
MEPLLAKPLPLKRFGMEARVGIELSTVDNERQSPGLGSNSTPNPGPAVVGLMGKCVPAEA